jgi:hypothetical protein
MIVLIHPLDLAIVEAFKKERLLECAKLIHKHIYINDEFILPDKEIFANKIK